MDDVAAMCDAGVSSSYHHHCHNDDLRQQQQLMNNAASVCSDWMTSSSSRQHQQRVGGNIRPLPSCSYRPGTHHALSAADSTTAGTSSTSDTLITKHDVRLLYICSPSVCVRTIHVKFTADFEVAPAPCNYSGTVRQRNVILK